MGRWWNKRRFDLVELVVIVAFAVVAVTIYFRAAEGRVAYMIYSAAQEGDRLRAKYGPSRFSRNEEEWVIRDYFQDRKEGVFVDIGANHYRDDSNTYCLETRLNWSGLAVDPQQSFAADYRKYPARTRFFSFLVSDTSDTSTLLHVVDGNSLVASQEQGFAERYGTQAKGALAPSRAVTVPTIRLTDLLEQVKIPRIDLLSIDVELAEPKVLAGFDIERFRPGLVCIEAHPQVRQQILDYFSRHRYVLLGRYLRADLQNLYFEPLR